MVRSHATASNAFHLTLLIPRFVPGFERYHLQSVETSRFDVLPPSTSFVPHLLCIVWLFSCRSARSCQPSPCFLSSHRMQTLEWQCHGGREPEATTGRRVLGLRFVVVAAAKVQVHLASVSIYPRRDEREGEGGAPVVVRHVWQHGGPRALLLVNIVCFVGHDRLRLAEREAPEKGLQPRAVDERVERRGRRRYQGHDPRDPLNGCNRARSCQMNGKTLC